MKFLPIEIGSELYSHKNLSSMALNLFKIKFFYEEEQIKRLEMLDDMQMKDLFIRINLEYSDNVSVYLKILTTFLFEDSTQEKNIQDLKLVLNFLESYKKLLKNEEILSDNRFTEWLQNSEYSL